MPPTKALRLALARAAEGQMDVALTVQGIRQEEIDQQTLLDGIGEGLLYLLLDGPGEEGGAIVFDLGALSALIEAQVLGRVLSGPAEARAPTATDAAMVAPLVDSLLAELAAALADDPAGWWAQGYRYARGIEDRRTLGLTLATGVFRSFRLSVDFENGAKQGEVQLILPVTEPPPRATQPPAAAPEAQPFGEQLQHVPVELTAIIDRVRLPLEEASQLVEGSVLPLSPGAMLNARLRGADGCDVARGELGQQGGYLALRVDFGPSARADPALPAPDDDTQRSPSRRAARKASPPAAKPAPEEAPDALPDLPPLTMEQEAEDAAADTKSAASWS